MSFLVKKKSGHSNKNNLETGSQAKNQLIVNTQFISVFSNIMHDLIS